MNDFKVEKPDPYKGIKTPKIERKKHLDKEKEQSFKPKKKILLIAIFYYFKKFISNFLKKSQTEEKLKYLKMGAIEFKKNLNILSTQNMSKDSEFLKNLSSSYKNFLEAYKNLYSYKNEKIEMLLKDFHNLYYSEEYPLSYYLEKYGEETWHPFPFIDILNKLHIEYQKDKKNSHLYKWISILEDLF